MSLGISYGFQESEVDLGQYSQIDVNGQRLTTSAGGQDDGANNNGALITVGGIGDNHINPSDPNATPVDARSDDELYDLRPFVNDGDESISISTLNPSADDNILFAAILLKGTRTIGAVDIAISMDTNPATEAERAPYEHIIRYFADGVYEVSNGAHKLGTVTFHTNNTESANANIRWITQNAGRPNAIPSGYGKPGAHINMFNRMAVPFWFDYSFVDNDEHQRAAGYALTHEFGHYYYGLYDEYAENQLEWEAIIYMPHAKDKPVPNSVMNNQWKAIDGDLKWLNFSTQKNNTSETAQHRVYGASSWETLARPLSEDPVHDEISAEWKRKYYSELVDVAPNREDLPRIDLPGDARSALRIIWESPTSTNSRSVNESPSTDQNIPLSAHLIPISGQNVSYPEPLLMAAFVNGDLFVTNLGIEATVTAPNGESLSVTFSDDGITPDALAGDGLYSAIVPYTDNGIHDISVSFDNTSGQALFVDKAFLPTQAPDGQTMPPQQPVPVDQDFLFTVNLQVVISNLISDDHGNTTESATKMGNNNESSAGRIDYAGDIDVFELNSHPDGITYVRITDRALGIQPFLRILAADGTTVIFAGSIMESGGNYLNQRIALPAGTRFFAEISDVDDNAATGLYRISAGSAVASDQNPPSSMVITATPDTIVADGVSTSSVTANVQDDFGNPVVGQLVEFDTSMGSIDETALTGSSGTVTVTLISGFQAGVATVTAAAGSVSATTQVAFVLPEVRFANIVQSISENGGQASVEVNLSMQSGVTVSVEYVAGGNALGTTAVGELIFAPGETTQAFVIPIIDDILNEADEVISLILHTPVNAILGDPAVATLTVVDDDPPPTVQFSSAAYSATENAGQIVIPVNLSAPSGFTVTVEYATGEDVFGTNAIGQLNFAPGETTQSFAIPVVDDTLDEADAVISLTLRTPVNATLGATAAATLTVVDDDPPPTVQFSSATYSTTENAGQIIIPVHLGAPSGFTVTVEYAAGGDAFGANAVGQLILAPGETAQSFAIPVVDNSLDEADAVISLTLRTPVNATLGATAAATLTVVDDDPPPTVQFSSATYSATENAGQVAIAVNLSAPSGFTVTVGYSSSDDAAQTGTENAATSGTLTYAPGETEKSFSVPILDDLGTQPERRVNLVLSNPVNATLGELGAAVLTILDVIRTQSLYLPVISR